MIAPNDKKYIVGVALGVLVLWAVVFLLSLSAYYCGDASSSPKWGQFGDAFGSVNALFSGLALLGVVAALLLQHKDIEVQSKSLAESARLQVIQARIAANAEMLRAWPEIEEAVKDAAPKGPAQYDTNNIKAQNAQAAQLQERKDQMLTALRECLEQLEEHNRR
ncbi:MAG: hypothetical protein DYG93_07685 [Leptolyngbya sp. PLA2]|nr:hypothetical protein [Leptolyngbya sp.]MCE7971528.1 hypothetical protein [Leptolyngbya sp. PL-A2]MCQ3940742.1 hypothetical protein [cyanobacterium CYA1]MDL1903712.1 hypothetical protein [Synechococcales cyanobacterium CNB]